MALQLLLPVNGLAQLPPEAPTCPERLNHQEFGITYFMVETEDQTIFYLLPPLTVGTITSADREGTNIRLTFPLTHEWSNNVLESFAQEIRLETRSWIEGLHFEPIPTLAISGFPKLGANEEDWDQEEFNPRHINYLGNSVVRGENNGKWQLVIRIPSSLKDEFEGSQKGDFEFEFYLFASKPVPGIPEDCWPLIFTVPLGAIPPDRF